MRTLKFIIAAAAIVPAAQAAPSTALVFDLPKFSAVELTGGGGEVILRHGPSQRVTLLSGDPNITRLSVPPATTHGAGSSLTTDGGDTLVINACNGDCPSGYRPRIEVVSPRIKGIAVNSGGKLIAMGPFPSQSSLGVAAMAGGEVDVRAMTARFVGAHASGGGIIRTRPLKQLGANAAAGGQILYSGNPKTGVQVGTGGVVTRVELSGDRRLKSCNEKGRRPVRSDGLFSLARTGRGFYSSVVVSASVR